MKGEANWLRIRWRSLAEALPLVFLFAAQVVSGAPVSEEEGMPKLLPPRGEIPPGFWEQYIWHVAAGGMVFLGLLALAAWCWTRPRAVAVLDPAKEALEQLEPLLGQPETGSVLTQVSQSVRRYFGSVFGLAAGELTTGEFAQGLAGGDPSRSDLAAAAVKFLRSCDERKFASNPPRDPLGAVSGALDLIARAEEALAAEAAAEKATEPESRHRRGSRTEV